MQELYDQAITKCIPKGVSKYIINKAPSTRLETLVNASIVATRVAQEMINTKERDVGLEENRDVMSLLGEYSWAANHYY